MFKFVCKWFGHKKIGIDEYNIVIKNLRENVKQIQKLEDNQNLILKHLDKWYDYKYSPTSSYSIPKCKRCGKEDVDNTKMDVDFKVRIETQRTTPWQPKFGIN